MRALFLAFLALTLLLSQSYAYDKQQHRPPKKSEFIDRLNGIWATNPIGCDLYTSGSLDTDDSKNLNTLRSYGLIEFRNGRFDLKYQAAQCIIIQSSDIFPSSGSFEAACEIKGSIIHETASLGFMGDNKVSIKFMAGGLLPMDLTRCPPRWVLHEGRDARSGRPFAILQSSAVGSPETIGIECQPSGVSVGIMLPIPYSPDFHQLIHVAEFKVGQTAIKAKVRAEPTSEMLTVFRTFDRQQDALRIVEMAVKSGILLITVNHEAKSIFPDYGRGAAIVNWAEVCSRLSQ